MRRPDANRRGSGPPDDRPDIRPDGQRIDRWLWHARFARTRTAAQKLALSGHVRVNRERVTSASRVIRVGDVLTIALGTGVRVVAVTAIAERRGSAEAARQIYDDRTVVAHAAADAAAAADGSRPVTGPVARSAAMGPVRGSRPDRRARRQGAAMKRGEVE